MNIQHCILCDEPTDRCEDDSLYLNDSGPFCAECYSVEIGQNIQGREK